MPDGILLVDKPEGPTSAGVVRVLKKRHRLASIGHLGTLDPLATGVLPLCVNAGTRIAQFLGAESKSYTGTFRLGVLTDTLDITGSVIEEGHVPSLDADSLSTLARSFVGQREQVPPMYSAIKVGGRKLYELARSGVAVERTPRKVWIERFTLQPAAERPDEIEFEVNCSKGTYVRVLAEEVGRACGTVAVLASLRRTGFGHFGIAECSPLEDLLTCETEALPMISLRDALRGTRQISVDARRAFAIASGQRAGLEGLAAPEESNELAALIAPDGRLLAVVEPEGGSWKLRRVTLPEASQLYRP